jgi:uncharacterized membrane protein YqgA involved in biofilm formation
MVEKNKGFNNVSEYTSMLKCFENSLVHCQPASFGSHFVIENYNESNEFEKLLLNALSFVWQTYKLANKVEQRFKKENSGESLSEGFVTATLLFCIGAMTITGSIQAGLANDNSILITKAILDFVSAIMLAASLGRGVLLSSISLLITQGLLVILSSIIAPHINDTVINEITCVGSLIIILIGTNLMGITKVKVADFLPAIIYTPVIYYLSSCIINLFK